MTAPGLPIKYTDAHWTVRKAARERYVELQGGICCHCGAPLSGPSDEDRNVNENALPSGFFRYPVHLHHDHHTDYTIGAVHAHCNAVLWEHYGE